MFNKNPRRVQGNSGGVLIWPPSLSRCLAGTERQGISCHGGEDTDNVPDMGGWKEASVVMAWGGGGRGIQVTGTPSKGSEANVDWVGGSGGPNP